MNFKRSDFLPQKNSTFANFYYTNTDTRISYTLKLMKLCFRCSVAKNMQSVNVNNFWPVNYSSVTSFTPTPFDGTLKIVFGKGSANEGNH